LQSPHRIDTVEQIEEWIESGDEDQASVVIASYLNGKFSAAVA
jgi:hypothetical protein